MVDRQGGQRWEVRVAFGNLKITILKSTIGSLVAALKGVNLKQIQTVLRGLRHEFHTQRWAVRVVFGYRPTRASQTVFKDVSSAGSGCGEC